jgi:hypothetical protein
MRAVRTRRIFTTHEASTFKRFGATSVNESDCEYEAEDEVTMKIYKFI